MSTTSNFDDLARAWLDEGPSQLSDLALDAALEEVHLTRQRGASRVPWRFPTMPALSRATGIAAVALVAVVGAGGLIYLTSDSGGAATRPTAEPTATPAASTSASSGNVAPGISRWIPYTSDVHEFWLGYPADWTVRAPATREWRDGDVFPDDELSYADTFVNGPGQSQIGLIVWRMPAGDGADVESFDGMKAWAQAFCSDAIEIDGSCGTFAERAERLTKEEYGAAILVPTADPQYAFIGECMSCVLVGASDWVTVVVVGRKDDFPAAAPYGGTVQLLRSVLTTMDVWSVGPALPHGWIKDVDPPS